MSKYALTSEDKALIDKAINAGFFTTPGSWEEFQERIRNDWNPVGAVERALSDRSYGIAREMRGITRGFADPGIGMQAAQEHFQQHGIPGGVFEVAKSVITSPIEAAGTLISTGGLGDRPLQTLTGLSAFLPVGRLGAAAAGYGLRGGRLGAGLQRAAGSRVWTGAARGAEGLDIVTGIEEWPLELGADVAMDVAATSLSQALRNPQGISPQQPTQLPPEIPQQTPGVTQQLTTQPPSLAALSGPTREQQQAEQPQSFQPSGIYAPLISEIWFDKGGDLVSPQAKGSNRTFDNQRKWSYGDVTDEQSIGSMTVKRVPNPNGRFDNRHWLVWFTGGWLGNVNEQNPIRFTAEHGIDSYAGARDAVISQIGEGNPPIPMGTEGSPQTFGVDLSSMWQHHQNTRQQRAERREASKQQRQPQTEQVEEQQPTQELPPDASESVSFLYNLRNSAMQMVENGALPSQVVEGFLYDNGVWESLDAHPDLPQDLTQREAWLRGILEKDVGVQTTTEETIDESDSESGSSVEEVSTVEEAPQEETEDNTEVEEEVEIEEEPELTAEQILEEFVETQSNTYVDAVVSGRPANFASYDLNEAVAAFQKENGLTAQESGELFSAIMTQVREKMPATETTEETGEIDESIPGAETAEGTDDSTEGADAEPTDESETETTEKPASTPQPKKIDQDEATKKVLSVVPFGEQIHINDIVRETDLQVSQVSTALLMLELNGSVQQLPGKYFERIGGETDETITDESGDGESDSSDETDEDVEESTTSTVETDSSDTEATDTSEQQTDSGDDRTGGQTDGGSETEQDTEPEGSGEADSGVSEVVSEDGETESVNQQELYQLLRDNPEGFAERFGTDPINRNAPKSMTNYFNLLLKNYAEMNEGIPEKTLKIARTHFKKYLPIYEKTKEAEAMHSTGLKTGIEGYRVTNTGFGNIELFLFKSLDKQGNPTGKEWQIVEVKTGQGLTSSTFKTRDEALGYMLSQMNNIGMDNLNEMIESTVQRRELFATHKDKEDWKQTADGEYGHPSGATITIVPRDADSEFAHFTMDMGAYDYTKQVRSENRSYDEWFNTGMDAFKEIDLSNKELREQKRVEKLEKEKQEIDIMKTVIAKIDNEDYKHEAEEDNYSHYIIETDNYGKIIADTHYGYGGFSVRVDSMQKDSAFYAIDHSVPDELERVSGSITQLDMIKGTLEHWIKYYERKHSEGENAETENEIEEQPTEPSEDVEEHGTPERVLWNSDRTKNYKVTYDLVELEDIQPSHLNDGTENPNYSQELQPREMRGGALSIAQTKGYAKDLKPRFLVNFFGTLTDGAPILSKKQPLNVLSGNGRVMALKEAFENHPDEWQKYQEALLAKVEEYGITQGHAEIMKAPVLVQQLTDFVDEIELAIDANKSSALDQTSAEQATQDARYLDDNVMSQWTTLVAPFSEAVTSPSNQDFRLALFKNIPAQERSGFLAADGNTLSAHGIERIKRMMFRYVFDEEIGKNLSQMLIENNQSEMRNIRNMLDLAIPAIAKLEGYIRGNVRDADASISEELARSIANYKNLVDNGETLDMFLQQTGLFTPKSAIDKLSLPAYLMLALFDAKKSAYAQLADVFTGYVDKVVSQGDSNQTALIQDEITSDKFLKENYFRNALKEHYQHVNPEESLEQIDARVNELVTAIERHATKQKSETETSESATPTETETETPEVPTRPEDVPMQDEKTHYLSVIKAKNLARQVAEKAGKPSGYHVGQARKIINAMIDSDPWKYVKDEGKYVTPISDDVIVEDASALFNLKFGIEGDGDGQQQEDTGSGGAVSEVNEADNQELSAERVSDAELGGTESVDAVEEARRQAAIDMGVDPDNLTEEDIEDFDDMDLEGEFNDYQKKAPEVDWTEAFPQTQEQKQATHQGYNNRIGSIIADAPQQERKRLFSQAKILNSGKYFQLRGRELGSVHEAAIISQFIRNPLVESTLILIRRNGKIVGADWFSLGKREATTTGSLRELQSLLDDLQADDFIRVHNHPSTVARFSEADRLKAGTALKFFGERYAGDVIVDDGTYAYNVKDETGQWSIVNDQQLDLQNGTPQPAFLGAFFKTQQGWTTFIITDSANRILHVTEKHGLSDSDMQKTTNAIKNSVNGTHVHVFSDNGKPASSVNQTFGTDSFDDGILRDYQQRANKIAPGSYFVPHSTTKGAVNPSKPGIFSRLRGLFDPAASLKAKLDGRSPEISLNLERFRREYLSGYRNLETLGPVGAEFREVAEHVLRMQEQGTARDLNDFEAHRKALINLSKKRAKDNKGSSRQSMLSLLGDRVWRYIENNEQIVDDSELAEIAQGWKDTWRKVLKQHMVAMMDLRSKIEARGEQLLIYSASGRKPRPWTPILQGYAWDDDIKMFKRLVDDASVSLEQAIDETPNLYMPHNYPKGHWDAIKRAMEVDNVLDVLSEAEVTPGMHVPGYDYSDGTWTFTRTGDTFTTKQEAISYARSFWNSMYAIAEQELAKKDSDLLGRFGNLELARETQDKLYSRDIMSLLDHSALYWRRFAEISAWGQHDPVTGKHPRLAHYMSRIESSTFGADEHALKVIVDTLLSHEMFQDLPTFREGEHAAFRAIRNWRHPTRDAKYWGNVPPPPPDYPVDVERMIRENPGAFTKEVMESLQRIGLIEQKSDGEWTIKGENRTAKDTTFVNIVMPFFQKRDLRIKTLERIARGIGHWQQLDDIDSHSNNFWRILNQTTTALTLGVHSAVQNVVEIPWLATMTGSKPLMVGLQRLATDKEFRAMMPRLGAALNKARDYLAEGELQTKYMSLIGFTATEKWSRLVGTAVGWEAARDAIQKHVDNPNANTRERLRELMISAEVIDQYREARFRHEAPDLDSLIEEAEKRTLEGAMMLSGLRPPDAPDPSNPYVDLIGDEMGKSARYISTRTFKGYNALSMPHFLTKKDPMLRTFFKFKAWAAQMHQFVWEQTRYAASQLKKGNPGPAVRLALGASFLMGSTAAFVTLWNALRGREREEDRNRILETLAQSQAAGAVSTIIEISQISDGNPYRASQMISAFFGSPTISVFSRIAGEAAAGNVGGAATEGLLRVPFVREIPRIQEIR